jgi:two-component system cell cycle sensor histidine kinase/response regulator CckA
LLSHSTTILNAALDGAVLIDEQGAIVGFNPAAERMFGRSRESTLGRDLAETLIPEHLREAHRQGFARLSETGTSSILDRRLALTALRSNGEEFPVELTISRVVDLGVARYVGFLRDETERLGIEAERDRLAAIVSSSAEAFWSCDLSGRITSWNAAAERLVGYSASEALGMSFTRLVPPERAAFLFGAIERIARGESIPMYEAVALHRDGRPVDIEVTFSPVRMADGTVAEMSAVVRDIAERRAAQASLAHQARILATVRDSMIETDAAFRIVDWNDAAEQLYGWTKAEVIGRLSWEVVRTKGEMDRERIVATLGDEGHVLIESIQETRTGAEIVVEASVIALRDGDGDVIGYVSLNRDVSARRRLEDRLRDARQFESIGRLAGGIAHEFNNLLTAMVGYGDLALADPALSAEIKADLEEIGTAAARAGALTQRLLAFSRQLVLQPRAVDVNVIVHEIGRGVDHTSGGAIGIERRLAPDLALAEVDAAQIEQVLDDLVENAREAMPDGGQVTIETANVVSGTQPPAGLALGDYISVTVSDAGMGMDAETCARVFDPYFTTKSFGAGLGLATAYGIVSQSGGDMSVTSEPGVGTSFTVLLPRFIPSPPTPIPEAPEPERGGTVLVVDDEVPLRILMARILRRQGFTVLETSDPFHALQLAEEAKANLALLVSDVELPGLSGGELSERIELLCPGIRILLVSGYPQSAAVRAKVAARRVAFLDKPFTPDTLAGKVREALATPV